MNFHDTIVNRFTTCRSKLSRNVPLSEVIKEIQYSESLKQATEQLRSLTPDQYRKRKRDILPAIAVSSLLDGRKTVVSHTGMLQVDIDNVSDVPLQEARAALIQDEHVLIVFISPSGKGLKAIVRILPDLEKHTESFLYAEKYFDQKYGLKIDSCCKDVNRLMFLCSDRDIFVNELARVLQPDSDSSTTPHATCYIGDIDNIENIENTGEYKPPMSSELPKSLCNMLCRMDSDNAIEEAFSKWQSKVNIEKSRLFEQLVFRTRKPEPNKRNDFIVNVGPRLYRATDEDVAFEFMMVFYDLGESIFRDSREQHSKEAKAFLNGVSQTYFNSLKDNEKEVYKRLDKCRQSAFRICLDLSKNEKSEFYMSSRGLAARLGMFDRQGDPKAVNANRILKYFEKYNIIKLLASGTKPIELKSVTKRLANLYKWTLPELINK
jgi:hypothetical protein